ncbi:MAG: D-glyceraldehyde dehydrogenase [Thermoplasmataceae archaeon]
MDLLISGDWRKPSTGEFLEKVSPVDGKVIGKFPAASKEDVDAAIEGAEKAQEAWYDLGSVSRSKILYKARELIEAGRKELESLLMRENGKVAIEARQEVDGVIDQVQYYAEFARKINGEIVEGDSSNRKILQYLVPYGVVVALTPWNFPAGMVVRKLAPALLTGNTVVLKPSSDTPFSAEWLVKIFQKAGVPKGVISLVTGRGSDIGDYIVSHRKVSLVTMTGSTATGQRIMQNASKNMAKLILELGGKAPYIVWKDADIKRALTTLMWAKFWNVGQSCIAAERLYVHSDIYKDFMKKFISAITKLKVGSPETADVGPLINRGALESTKKFVEKAKEEGGRVITGGGVPKLPDPYSHGFFFQPTVIEGLGQESELFQEEVFGPVIGAAEISSEDEAISKANNSKYGLASYLFTRDPDFIFRAAEKVKFGELYVNMPGPESSQGYHTGFRLTGQAGEGSRHGIREYLKLKNVYIDYSKGDLRIETVRPDIFD